MTPGFLTPLFTTFPGAIILTIALALWGFGILLVLKVSKIDV
jgi:Flp pilus assembly protein TadB